MTTDERRQLLSQLATGIQEMAMEEGHMPDPTNGKVQAPPNESGLLNEELHAIEVIYQVLDPLSVEARGRCMTFVGSFLHELEVRERRELHMAFAPQQDVEPLPGPAFASAERRR